MNGRFISFKDHNGIDIDMMVNVEVTTSIIMQSDNSIHGRPLHTYEGLSSLQNIVMQEATTGGDKQRDYVVFEKVPRKIIQTLLADTEFLRPETTAITEFDKARKQLVIKMPTSKAHEAATGMLIRIVERELGKAGVAHMFVPTVRATFESADGERGKEPDYSWMIVGDGWPAIIIEVGLSESGAKLREDAHFWLLAGADQGRIALTLNIEDDELCLTSWVVNTTNDDVHIGAKMTATRMRDDTWVLDPSSPTDIRIPARNVLLDQTPFIAQSRELVIEANDLISLGQTSDLFNRRRH
ncbi:hypothetical protein AAP_05897 [Ascosphaera apis ARSEF 7405]|uniref:Uncharacterized protein n=1 Tax=Ascosphaera apis ARSEF 7405 TaxID=392613 RepID=A0A162ICP5_9EURO|nr:hypothetical protein AAP_05897 [Ascosphaera apis ARSEF 7405]